MLKKYLLILLLLNVPAWAETVLNPQEALQQINQFRAAGQQCGSQFMPAVRPLKWNALLANISQAHAQDMAFHHYFDHNSLDGRTPAMRTKQAGYTGFGGFENIAAGRETVSEVLQDWLKSAGHCRNIMNPELTEVGMAVAYNEQARYRYYWVQNFGMDLETFKREKPGYRIP